MNLNINFDFSKTIAGKEILEYGSMIEVIPNIKNILLTIGSKLGDNYINKGNSIWISKTAKIAENATIIGPCIIGDNSEIRHCAYIRGNVIIGKNCVVGNSTELKNCILFDSVQVPHFNYVGDSILGYKSHLGAGAIISNFKNDKTNIIIDKSDTGLRKMGAIIGDNVEVGCNSVIYPGTIIGRNTTVYPLTSVRGIVDKNIILKNEISIKKRIVYIDFDSTLYATDKLFLDILKLAEKYGISSEEIEKEKSKLKSFNIYKVLDNIGRDIDNNLYAEISELIKNGNNYLFEDSREFIRLLKSKKYQVNILTYGEYDFQMEKISNCDIINYIDDVIITDKEKSDIGFIDYQNGIFLDDKIETLESLYKMNANVIRIRRRNTGNYDKILSVKEIKEFDSLIDTINLF